MNNNGKVTMRQVAETSGVSISTVSMILNHRPGVSFSDETVRKVLETAQALGYTPKPQPTLAVPQSGPKRIIAVFCPNLTNSYYSTICQSIEQAAYTKGYRTMVITTYRDPAIEVQMIRSVIEAGVSGIIFTMMPNAPDYLEQIAQNFPVVVIGDKTSNYSFTQIYTSNYAAGVILAEHLYKLGHRQVVFISTTLGDQLSLAMRSQRLLGVKETFRKLCMGETWRVLPMEEKIEPEQERKNINLEYGVGYNLCRRCLEDRSVDGITAFIGSNDMVAYGIMDAILKKGYSIPRDYSVCGFDNVFASSLLPISLTSVEHYMVDKGKQAVSMLYEKMEGGQSGPNSRKNPYLVQIEYTPHLVVRSSTGAPSMGYGHRK